MIVVRVLSTALAVLMLLSTPARAEESGCSLIVSYPSATVLKQAGDCARRYTPMSSFKMPLAVMGFDSGILADQDHPVWAWPQDDDDVMEMHKKDAGPALWMKDSFVWYSQHLTRAMGMEKFAGYVEQFGYGNLDVTGDQGKDNGLTHSWLMSSLAISPEEQVAFLGRFMDRELGVSDKAYEMTAAIMPDFTAGAWRVQGKTGSGWILNDDGTRNKSRPLGWFIGWARKGDETVLFARLFAGDKPIEGYGGQRARESLLAELARIP